VLPRDAVLEYPLEWPEPAPGGPRPNILILVVDSWRRDVFTAENTPQLHAFAAAARVFENHLSSGNGTRFGVFSMLYGLHGSYWFPVLEAHRPPVLLDVLRRNGYELRVLSSASMNFPEFRQTAWVGMEASAIEDEHDSRYSHECDVFVAEKFSRWLDERGRRADERPFFAFVLLDSPHQPYYSPEGGPYQPSADDYDYLELAGTVDAALHERIFNRYRNAVVHADRIAGRILVSLAEAGVLDDTLVVVTGDHGEEFHECGFWGHTSNFSPQQTEVPFYMRGPGIIPGVEDRPTSHLDLPTTLLEMMGADPAMRSGWCLGENLLDPPEQRARVLAGWSDLGLVLREEILRIPFEPFSRDVEFYDQQWKLLPSSTGRLRLHRAEVERLANDCTRFLRVQP
jgi:membrane-anchored protein YejM (alkaline phosphatase superfamily)